MAAGNSLIVGDATSQRYHVGLDLGRARCGLATALEGSSLALPLAVVPTEPQATLAARIRAALAHRAPSLLVAGLPLDQHGKEGDAARWARELGERLATELGAPLCFIDERFSTREAYGIRQQAGAKAKRNRESIDAAAATVILQAYLDQQAMRE
jgi:putative holliday junction resolvase